MYPSEPTEANTHQPSSARMYDYALGGAHNFAVDRVAMREMHGILGDQLWHAGWANRSFLHRAVRFCLDQGISQFLDLGSGIPTVGNVHQIAHRYNPKARVVYVDYETVAVRHTRSLLADEPHAAMVEADFREPPAVLQDSQTRALLDFSQPIALLAVAALHYVSESDDITRIMQTYREQLAAGSVIALSHLTADGDPDTVTTAREQWNASVADPMTMRSFDQLRELLDSLAITLVEPGLVWGTQWRPDPDDPASNHPPQECGHWAALGIVPG